MQSMRTCYSIFISVCIARLSLIQLSGLMSWEWMK